MTVNPVGLPKQVADRYVAKMREPGVLACALNWYRALATPRAYRVGHVSVPTTLVWGTETPPSQPMQHGSLATMRTDPLHQSNSTGGIGYRRTAHKP
jgi:hypothetical protein